MSTIPLRASGPPQIHSVPGFTRIGAFLMAIVEAYADAQRSMREAQKKYPYAGV